MRNRVNKWLFLVVSIIVIMQEFGLVFAFSAVFVSMLDKFLETRSAIATLMSLFLGVTLSFGVISGMLITRFGLASVIFVSSLLVPLGFCASFFATNVRFLYISIGIICGIGISMAHISCIVAVSRVFTGSQRDLFLTIVNTSIGLATLAYPYFLEWLLTLYSLSGTLLILGGISCNSYALFVLCFINRKELQQTKVLDSPTTSEKTRCGFVVDGIRYIKSLSNIPYILMVLASGLSIASLNGFIGLMLDISIWKGYTNSQGLLCYVFNGSFNTVARLIPGLLKQRKGVNTFTFLIVSPVFGCIGQLVLYFSTTFEVYIIGMSLCGITVGGIISSGVNVVHKLVQEEHVAVAIGIFFTTIGLLSVGVGPIFGTIRDTSGSYNSVFIAVSASNVVAGILYTAAMLIRRHRRQRSEGSTDCDNRSHETVTSVSLMTKVTSNVQDQ